MLTSFKDAGSSADLSADLYPHSLCLNTWKSSGTNLLLSALTPPAGQDGSALLVRTHLFGPTRRWSRVDQ